MKRLNTGPIKLLAAGLCLLVGTAVSAQEKEKEPEITKIPGQPVLVKLPNGNVITYKVKQTFAPLKSTVTLAENSCSAPTGLKWGYVAPVVFKSLVPVWVVHPTKAGLFLTRYEEDEKQDRVRSVIGFLTRRDGARFGQILSQLPANDAPDQTTLKLAKENPSAMGWFDCQNTCETAIPKNQDILTWDENFEMQNQEIAMSRNADMSINQMSARYEGITLRLNGQRLEFSKPKRTYGYFANFFPMGVTYQIQLSFQAPNLVEPDDGFCQMKWDMDFGSIFTLFTQLSNEVQDTEKIKSVALSDYRFDPEDEKNPTFTYLFSPDEYKSTDYSK